MSPGLIAFFVVIAVLLACYAAFAPSRVTVIDDDDYMEVETISNFDKWIRPTVKNLIGVAPNSILSYAKGSGSVASILIRSGNPWNVTPEEYIILRIVSGFVLAGVLSAYSSFGALPIGPIPAFLGGFALGYFIPQSLLSAAWNKRKKDVTKTLPEALDLTRVCLSVGLNFMSALPEVVRLLPDGTTKSELGRVNADISAGRTVNQSLADFAHRVPIEQVEAFVSAISIANAMGTSMSTTLENQANEARAQYERVVEVKSQKLQTTLFLPVIGLLFPSLLILIFGPSLADLMSFL